MAPHMWPLLVALFAGLLPGRGHDSLGADECNLAPSTDELKTFCFDEIAACDKDPQCRALLDSPDEVEPFPPPPKTFQAVMDCMRHTDEMKQAGWKPPRRQKAAPKPSPPPPARKKQPHRPERAGKYLVYLPDRLVSRFTLMGRVWTQPCAKLLWSCSVTRACSFWRTSGPCCCTNLILRLEKHP